MTLDTYLAQRSDRCSDCGHHVPTQGHGTTCADLTEWTIFRTAVKQAVRPDGTVHQAEMRPLIRGRIQPKSIGRLYRRAKAEGLLSDTGIREPSNDDVGRNTDKLDRIYSLRSAA